VKENPNRQAINYSLHSERENRFKSLPEYYKILCLLTISDKEYSHDNDRETFIFKI